MTKDNFNDTLEYIIISSDEVELKGEGLDIDISDPILQMKIRNFIKSAKALNHTLKRFIKPEVQLLAGDYIDDFIELKENYIKNYNRDEKS